VACGPEVRAARRRTSASCARVGTEAFSGAVFAIALLALDISVPDAAFR
jgi:hypothetical protein